MTEPWDLTAFDASAQLTFRLFWDLTFDDMYSMHRVDMINNVWLRRVPPSNRTQLDLWVEESNTYHNVHDYGTIEGNLIAYRNKLLAGSSLQDLMETPKNQWDGLLGDPMVPGRIIDLSCALTRSGIICIYRWVPESAKVVDPVAGVSMVSEYFRELLHLNRPSFVDRPMREIYERSPHTYSYYDRLMLQKGLRLGIIRCAPTAIFDCNTWPRLGINMEGPQLTQYACWNGASCEPSLNEANFCGADVHGGPIAGSNDCF